MKKILIAFLLITAQTAYGQDCKTRAADKPSESVRFQNDYTRSGDGPKVTINIAKLKPQLTIAEKLQSHRNSIEKVWMGCGSIKSGQVSNNNHTKKLS